MRYRAHIQKLAIVTTSWDDGHPLDMRIAQLLHFYGIVGTFYIPIQYRQCPQMNQRELRALRNLGMEIGAHTLTHRRLTRLTKEHVLEELLSSKEILEEVLENPVVSFCYPEGKFNHRVSKWVSEAGYKVARTTVAFRTEGRFDAYRMPVSFQLLPHKPRIHLRHALREGNIRGLLAWFCLWNMESDLLTLTNVMLDHIVKHGGVLHIWGHSWEIEQYGLWETTKKILNLIGNRPGVYYLTNAQVLQAIE